MKFPYGMCDFYKIIIEDYFFIDRTDRIPMLENVGDHLLFLRPRRFGKSMLLSMLENYYDVVKTDEWEQIFGHLAAGKNPTKRRSSYLVMNWDFSCVNTQGTPEQIQVWLHNHINGCIEQFIARYRDILDYDIRPDPDDAMRSFQSVLAAVQSSPYKLYLLIDEYDNFANEVMMGHRPDSKDRYNALLSGEGSLKAIFKVVKSATKGLGLDRAFITGVSPVVMSDITSGHNIAEDISLFPMFNDLCGFLEKEIDDEIRHIVNECDMPKEKGQEAMSMMRTFYNGYCFTYRSEQSVYNPTLALYFMKNLQRECRYPDEILDSNLSMDKNKISYISRLPNGEKIIMDAVENNEPVITSKLAGRFGVEDMLSANKDNSFMVSLLYYFGVLTLTDKRTPMGELVMKIPNLVIRRLYVERLQEMLLPEFQDKEDVRRITRKFYQTGDMQPLCDFLENRYFKIFNNRDYRWANELTIKTAFLTLLFNDTFYIMDSEPSLERRYADLIMIVRPDMRQYELLDFLIEFKFVDLGKNKLSKDKIKNMSMEELSSLAPVKAKLEQAKQEIIPYCETLKQTYKDKLRLKTYAVVAVGFERMVWENVEN